MVFIQTIKFLKSNKFINAKIKLKYILIPLIFLLAFNNIFYLKSRNFDDFKLMSIYKHDGLYLKLTGTLNKTAQTTFSTKKKLVLIWEPFRYFDDVYINTCKSPCQVTHNKSLINEADAVLIHGWIFPKAKLPENRTEKQRWIYILNESPANSYYYSNKIIYKKFNGLFNWTLTYRSDSDIRILPYRLEKLSKKKKIPNYAKIRSKFALIIVSNCKNKERMDLVRQMQNYAPNLIDVYGKCGIKCDKNCKEKINEYKFYLSFENSFYCKDYITEKFWQNGFMYGAVPVVKGARKVDFMNLNLPNHSFIHVDDYKNIQDLVDYMLYLHKNPDQYNLYHVWRSYYRLKANYIGHWCDICTKLHQDQTIKVYYDFEHWYNSCENVHFT